jgi:hypothetical protein
MSKSIFSWVNSSDIFATVSLRQSSLIRLPISLFLLFVSSNTHNDNIYYQHHNVAIKALKPCTLEGFEPWIFCSGGGRDDHYATMPGHFLAESIVIV